jgi:two-component system chemotaxis response regulator CheY
MSRRALVVDDSSAMRMLLRAVLRQQGFEVAEARDGRDALEVLRQAGPMDLALMDWNMPEMGGLELLSALRSDSRYDGMRVMMVTTETDLAEVRQALQTGANEYVMKPFSKDAIVDKLKLIGF